MIIADLTTACSIIAGFSSPFSVVLNRPMVTNIPHAPCPTFCTVTVHACAGIQCAVGDSLKVYPACRGKSSLSFRRRAVWVTEFPPIVLNCWTTAYKRQRQMSRVAVEKAVTVQHESCSHTTSPSKSAVETKMNVAPSRSTSQKYAQNSFLCIAAPSKTVGSASPSFPLLEDFCECSDYL